MSTAKLLRKAANALSEGNDPFAGSFLSENDVSFDQCMTLAEQLAIGARMVAHAIEHPKSPAGLVYALALAGATL